MHTFVGSVNGLVCSSRPPLRPTNVTIWNPATHRCKNISVPRIDIKYVWSILVGFGFNFVEIQMFKGPEYVKKDTTSSSNMALGDFVAQAVCSPGAQANDMIHIYTLEENAGVWMRMYSFGLPGVQRPVRLKCFKNVLKNGKIVFTNGNQNKLYMYDLTSGKVKTLMVAQGRDMIHMPMNYTESLVSIEGMVSVGEGALTNLIMFLFEGENIIL
ncbi:hypothetical protein DCAR_0100774 [Daucus carota subsp. sativus]|uniref:F-box associated domain-containing protein n=1 Tax=Daucus carota subsp. sativus TaxID=79200 RepID=A0AAF0W4V1_DAUCS|nr:hypothetical protein DCAR_0100774 [Daucus carota subsp. sativus]